MWEPMRWTVGLKNQIMYIMNYEILVSNKLEHRYRLSDWVSHFIWLGMISKFFHMWVGVLDTHGFRFNDVNYYEL